MRIRLTIAEYVLLVMMFFVGVATILYRAI
jgi:hypothetical protein